MANKIVVIGLDGATWDLINPLIEEGCLPVLGRLVAQGSHGVLQSTKPPVSPIAWTTFLTGTNPGKHGIYGFTKRIDGEYNWTAVSALDRAGYPLWDYTDKYGLRSCFLYVPFTYPTSPLNGVMISGLGTPGIKSEFVYPPELQSELIEKFEKRYLFEPHIKGSQEQILVDILASIEVQADVLQYVMSKESYDLTVFVFGQTDRVQHFFWKEMDPNHPDHDSATSENLKGAIRTVYEHIDAVIGRVYESIDEDTTLIIMSDHGFGPYYREFYPNNWLAQEGYLSYKNSNSRKTEPLISQWVYKIIYSAIGLVEGRIPQKIVWPLRKYGLLSKLDQFNNNPTASEIDWQHTRVYSADFWGNLFLNLKDREPEGIVEPGQEADELLGEVIKRLGELRDPETGIPIIQSVYRQTDLYEGSFTHQAPDLIVYCNHDFTSKPQPLGQHDHIVAPAGKFRHATLQHSAEHRPEGIVLLSGAKISQNLCLENANIADLAPTILYLLGCPLTSTFDGVPLITAIRPEFQQEGIQPAAESDQDSDIERPNSELSDSEVREIEDRLRALGYL